MEHLIEKLKTKLPYVGLMTLKNGKNIFVSINYVDEVKNVCSYSIVTKEIAEGYLKTGDTVLYENAMEDEIALADIINYYPYDELTTIIKDFEDIKRATGQRMETFIKALVKKNSRKR